MTLSAYLGAYPPFSWVQAPIWIWLAAIVLFLVPIISLRKLLSFVQGEQRLYQRIARDLRAIKSKYSFDLRNGLPLVGYEEIGQCFETTPLAPFWDIFAAQFVKRYDDTGTDRFWSPQSAATVFNETSMLESRLNRNVYTAIPGIVTGFGLLCTFIAILDALLEVKLANKQFTGLDKLVSGLSGKFLSSIAALFSATVFLLCEKGLSHNLTKSLRELVIALDALVPRLTSAHLLNEIRTYLEEQSTAFKHFNSDLSTKLKQGVEEGMGPTRDRMVGAIEELNQFLRTAEAQKSDTLTGSLDGLLQNLSHSLTSALASLSDRFAQTLSSSANQEFDQVVSTLGGTARLLEGMNVQFQASHTTLTELVNLARNTTVEQMALGKTQVEELTAVLRGLMTQMHQATDTSVNHITTTLTAAVHDLSTRVTELGQHMSQSVTASAGEATGMARAVIERADQWSTRSTEQLAQLLEKHHSQLDRVQNVQHILDATLEQFRETLSNYTIVTRNFSQIVTQTSTMVAATTGSTKDIQEAGKAIERVAQQAATQVESFRGIIGSLHHYEEIFSRVQDTAGKLLMQIDQHLRGYQETTKTGYEKLTILVNSSLADATSKLGATVNELDEHLQDLTEILGRVRS